MKYLYQTPNTVYRISKQNDPIWFEIFNIESEKPIAAYYISRYEPSLASWNVHNPDARLSDYIIIQSKETLEECFQWLKKYNIISKDEMEYQIKRFSEIAEFLPLTDSE